MNLSDEQQRVVDFLSKYKYCPLYSERIFRSETELPKWVAPSFSVVHVASPELLQCAGHIPGSTPDGWRSDRPGVFWKPVDCWTTLRVRKFGEFWSVERRMNRDEILHNPGGPLCARTMEGAMRLAEFCNIGYNLTQVGLQWIDLT